MFVPFDAPAPGSPLQRLWRGLRFREGVVALLTGATWLAFWAWTKPTLFFHVAPAIDAGIDLAPDIAQNRLDFAADLGLSGALLGILSPVGLVAGIPVGFQMAVNPREWGAMTGPAAHYHAFWLPFVLASAIAGAARLGRLGAPALVLGLALPFSWAVPRRGPVRPYARGGSP